MNSMACRLPAWSTKEKWAEIQILQRQQLSPRQRSEIYNHELEIELLRQDIED